MSKDADRHDDPCQRDRDVDPSRGKGVVAGLIVVALILAIGFFYMTNERRQDRRADALTRAAAAVDETTRIVGDAARNAADTLRNDDD